MAARGYVPAAEADGIAEELMRCLRIIAALLAFIVIQFDGNANPVIMTGECEKFLEELSSSPRGEVPAEFLHRSQLRARLQAKDIWSKFEQGQNDAKYLSLDFVGKDRPDLRNFGSEMVRNIDAWIMRIQTIPESLHIVRFAMKLRARIEQRLAEPQFLYADFLNLSFPYIRLLDLLDALAWKHFPDQELLQIAKRRNYMPDSLARLEEVLMEGGRSRLLSVTPLNLEYGLYERRRIELLKALEPIIQYMPSVRPVTKARFIGLIGGSGTYIGYIDKTIFHEGQLYTPLGFLEHDHAHNLQILQEAILTHFPRVSFQVRQYLNPDTTDAQWSASIRTLRAAIRNNWASMVQSRETIERKYTAIFDRMRAELSEREALIGSASLFQTLHEMGSILTSRSFVMFPSKFFTEEFMNQLSVSELQHELALHHEGAATARELRNVHRYLETIPELSISVDFMERHADPGRMYPVLFRVRKADLAALLKEIQRVGLPRGASQVVSISVDESVVFASMTPRSVLSLVRSRLSMYFCLQYSELIRLRLPMVFIPFEESAETKLSDRLKDVYRLQEEDFPVPIQIGFVSLGAAAEFAKHYGKQIKVRSRRGAALVVTASQSFILLWARDLQIRSLDLADKSSRDE